jgi:hypothetical protein
VKFLLLPLHALDGECCYCRKTLIRIVIVLYERKLPVESGDKATYRAELLVEALAKVKHILGEDVFLAVDPKEREGFLSAIKDLRKEAALSVLLLLLLLAVQDLVGLRKFGPVVLVYRLDFKDLNESLEAHEEISASRGTLI